MKTIEKSLTWISDRIHVLIPITYMIWNKSYDINLLIWMLLIAINISNDKIIELENKISNKD